MSSIGQQAVELAKSRQGKNSYTQSAKRTQVFSGYSDCSSLCWKIYERLGIFIGTWTGEQVTKGTQIWKNTSQGAYAALPQSAVNLMQPGDLIFYGSGSATHVEMYMGGGQQIGHGSGMGPTIKNCLAYRHKSGAYQIRRYTGGNSQSTANTGGSSYMFSVNLIKSGSTGKDVLLFQKIAKATGDYTGQLDSAYGPLCKEACRKIQQRNYPNCGTADGECGVRTWPCVLGV